MPSMNTANLQILRRMMSYSFSFSLSACCYVATKFILTCNAFCFYSLYTHLPVQLQWIHSGRHILSCHLEKKMAAHFKKDLEGIRCATVKSLSGWGSGRHSVTGTCMLPMRLNASSVLTVLQWLSHLNTSTSHHAVVVVVGVGGGGF